IIKMHNSSKATIFEGNCTSVPVEDEIVPVDNTQVNNVPVKCTSSKKSVPVGHGKGSHIIINGQLYQSIRDASQQLGIHRNTIKKRLNDDSNADYVYLD